MTKVTRTVGARRRGLSNGGEDHGVAHWSQRGIVGVAEGDGHPSADRVLAGRRWKLARPISNKILQGGFPHMGDQLSNTWLFHRHGEDVGGRGLKRCEAEMALWTAVLGSEYGVT